MGTPMSRALDGPPFALRMSIDILKNEEKQGAFFFM